MSFFSRGKHDRRASPRKFPPPIRMTVPPSKPPQQDTVASPAPPQFSRPYPGRRGSQPPWPGRPYMPPESSVRDGVLLTARASDLRIGIRCLCGREHHNVNADTFADLYASARDAEWQEDQFRTWRCTRCARRYQAVFGVPPVAAIERGAA